MKDIITQKNYKTFLRGASLFTTGGGVTFVNQIATVDRLRNLCVPVFSPKDFSKNAYFCLAAELGPTDTVPIKKVNTVFKMMRLLCDITKKRIEGIYEPELGQESVLLETASLLQLPIIDFDLVGFRAVPFVDINIFCLKNIDFSYSPMIVCNNKEEIFIVATKMSDKRLEETLRRMTCLSKTQSLFVMGGVISVQELVKNNLTRPSLQKAFFYGAIKNKKTFLQRVSSKKDILGRVVFKKILDIDGFSAEVIFIEDKRKTVYKLIVLNEVLFLLDEKKTILYAVPDRILLIDPIKMIGLSASTVEKGMEVFITVISPEKEWENTKAKQLFGQRRFQFLLKALT